MSKQFLLLVSLAGLPLVSHAQTTSPRFYVGVGATLLTDVPFTSAGVPRLLGPSVTIGKQLGTRLALQLGVSYFWQNESSGYSYVYYDPSGQAATNSTTYTTNSKYLLIPVLLRYTFTAPGKRFNVDGLGGITGIYSHRQYVNIYYYTQIPFSEEYTSSSGRINLSLGPSVRYTLSSNIELTANGLVNATIGDSYPKFSQRLFLNTAIGVHYTFGQR